MTAYDLTTELGLRHAGNPGWEPPVLAEPDQDADWELGWE